MAPLWLLLLTSGYMLDPTVEEVSTYTVFPLKEVGISIIIWLVVTEVSEISW